MSRADRVFYFGALAAVALLCSAFAFVVGLALGGETSGGGVDLPVATVTLAPSGMAYCPTDPATVHPVPCETRP